MRLEGISERGARGVFEIEKGGGTWILHEQRETIRERETGKGNQGRKTRENKLTRGRNIFCVYNRVSLERREDQRQRRLQKKKDKES